MYFRNGQLIIMSTVEFLLGLGKTKHSFAFLSLNIDIGGSFTQNFTEIYSS
jgi:hypothetical protein